MAKKEDNLIPQAHVLTVEEASKGGRASADARRQKRDLKRAMDILLERDIMDSKGETRSGAEYIAMQQFKKALKGDTKAFEVIRDTAGQKPVDKIQMAEVDVDVLMQVENMVMNDDE